MSEQTWPRQSPPPARAETVAVWEWQVHSPADLTTSRRQLQALAADTRSAGELDDLERLLLAYEELASNGFRHGRPPVRTVVSRSANGWLIDVTDASPGNSPVPAVDRDPALGGLGLHLVARLCAAHGWWVEAGRKHVWGCVQLTAG